MRRRQQYRPGEFGAQVIEAHELAVGLEFPRYRANGRVRGLSAPEEIRDTLTRDGEPVLFVWTRRVGPFFCTDVVSYAGRPPWERQQN